ncbi:beta-propeller domain-containing protein [Cytobacillus depressus]|nr:beta-propeller domain-containing protein [Cytobacillus depressus]
MKIRWMLVGSVFALIGVIISIFQIAEEKSVHGIQAVEKKDGLPSFDSKSSLNSLLLKRFKAVAKEEKTSVAMDMVSQESAKAESAGADYSETNVQVEGIDEGDLLKTDGTHIYQVSDGKVQIIQAAPANQMKVDSVISFETSFSPYQLFLYDDLLMVIGHSYGNMVQTNAKEMAKMMIAPIDETMKAVIYDVKNKQRPQKIRELEVEGSLLASRLMDGKVYVITNKYPQIWLLRENTQMDIRPKYSDSAKQTEMEPVDYSKIKYFPDSNETNFTNIAVIDLEKPTEKMSFSTYVGSGQNIYMSKNNLYLAVTNYESSLLGDNQSKTTVYKFTVNGMEVEFKKSAEVPGNVLNQFSMDEYNGHFRIATTKGQVWNDRKPSANNLYILDENLTQVGKLEDLAKGERIYSARFMNDRIYIVTFRETDPLFVIDGKDPKNPQVLGELKIPGFSNYLHPIDDNHLLGFGYDTKVLSGKGAGNQPIILTDGVKLSIFDVTDMKNPQEKFTEIIGGRGTYSPLNYDHKAMLFDKKNHLFAFPISVYQNSKKSEFESIYEFQGAYVYNIDLQSGFSLKAKITHQDPKAPYEEWENNIQRLMYIGDSLYATSPEKISSYERHSLKKEGELSLK